MPIKIDHNPRLIERGSQVGEEASGGNKGLHDGKINNENDSPYDLNHITQQSHKKKKRKEIASLPPDTISSFYLKEAFNYCL